MICGAIMLAMKCWSKCKSLKMYSTIFHIIIKWKQQEQQPQIFSQSTSEQCWQHRCHKNFTGEREGIKLQSKMWLKLLIACLDYFFPVFHWILKWFAIKSLKFNNAKNEIKLYCCKPRSTDLEHTHTPITKIWMI